MSHQQYQDNGVRRRTLQRNYDTFVDSFGMSVPQPHYGTEIDQRTPLVTAQPVYVGADEGAVAKPAAAVNNGTNWWSCVAAVALALGVVVFVWAGVLTVVLVVHNNDDDAHTPEVTLERRGIEIGVETFDVVSDMGDGMTAIADEMSGLSNELAEPDTVERRDDVERRGYSAEKQARINAHRDRIRVIAQSQDQNNAQLKASGSLLGDDLRRYPNAVGGSCEHLDDDDDDDNDGPYGLVCHYPRGNPENFREKCLPESAIDAHVALHADHRGLCPSTTQEACDALVNSTSPAITRIANLVVSPQGNVSACGCEEDLCDRFDRIEAEVSEAGVPQTLTYNATSGELSIAGGNAVNVAQPDAVDDADADPTNELQDLLLAGTTLSVSDGNSVDLSPLQCQHLDCSDDDELLVVDAVPLNSNDGQRNARMANPPGAVAFNGNTYETAVVASRCNGVINNSDRVAVVASNTGLDVRAGLSLVGGAFGSTTLQDGYGFALLASENSRIGRTGFGYQYVSGVIIGSQRSVVAPISGAWRTLRTSVVSSLDCRIGDDTSKTAQLHQASIVASTNSAINVGFQAAIVACQQCTIGDNAQIENSFIAASRDSVVTGTRAAVVGGVQNVVSVTNGATLGGYDHQITGTGGGVAVGGTSHRNTGTYGTSLGGYNARATGYYATVVGGSVLTASGTYASTFGGYSTLASGTYSTVAGGYDGEATGYASFVGGGLYSDATGLGAATLGGSSNKGTGRYAVTVGGATTTVDGWYSASLATEASLLDGAAYSAVIASTGVSMTATSGTAQVAVATVNGVSTLRGNSHFISGHAPQLTSAKCAGATVANHVRLMQLLPDYTTLGPSDSYGWDAVSACEGGYFAFARRFHWTNGPGAGGSGMSLVAGVLSVTGMTYTSNANVKTGFEPVDGAAVLDGLRALEPVSTWSFIEPAARRTEYTGRSSVEIQTDIDATIVYDECVASAPSSVPTTNVTAADVCPTEPTEPVAEDYDEELEYERAAAEWQLDIERMRVECENTVSDANARALAAASSERDAHLTQCLLAEDLRVASLGTELNEALGAEASAEAQAARNTTPERHVGPTVQQLDAAFGPTVLNARVTTADSAGISASDSIGLLYAIVQAQQAKIDELETRLAAVEVTA